MWVKEIVNCRLSQWLQHLECHISSVFPWKVHGKVNNDGMFREMPKSFFLSWTNENDDIQVRSKILIFFLPTNHKLFIYLIFHLMTSRVDLFLSWSLSGEEENKLFSWECAFLLSTICTWSEKVATICQRMTYVNIY